MLFREFHGSPVVRTWHFHSHGLGSVPVPGTKIPQATWNGQIHTHTHTLNIVYSDSKKRYLGISVTRHVLEFHAKSYKMLIRESKGDINN